MADIKTRDAVKGTIKTLDKAAVAGERMKSAYAKTKDKAEQGYYAEENSPTEYAADKVSHASGRIKDEGIHQFNKQGQKNAEATRENIGKAKDKIADFKAKRAKKAAEQKTMRNKAGQNAMRTMGQDGLQEIQGTASRPAVSAASAKTETPQTAANSLIKTRQQGKRTIKTTARNAEKTVKATEKGVKTAKATAEATKATVKATIAAVKAIIAGTKVLISALIAGGWIAIVIILIVVLLGCAVFLFGGGSESTSYTPVSAEVEAYTPLIQKYAKQYGIPEYVELIKAVMMQESGGKGSGPMQAAEGSFNKRYPHQPNSIKDPDIPSSAVCRN